MSWLPLNLDPKQLKADMEQAVPGLMYRAMFGGYGVYVGGKIVAGITDQGMAVKASLTGIEAALALPEARMWQWDPHGPTSKQYVVLRPEDAYRWLRERL